MPDAGRATATEDMRAPVPTQSAPARAVASIVAVGFRSEAFVPGAAPVDCFVAQPGRDDVQKLVDAVRSAVESGGHVLAIYPAWDPEPALRRLETVGAALDTASLAVYPTSLPPLVGAVLASLASAAAAHIPSAGLLHAGLPALEKELVVCAWLGSVAGLSRPAPSLAQHILSAAPTTSFGVSLQPQEEIRRLTKTDRSIEVPSTHRPMCLVVAARDEAGANWIDEVIAPALGSPPIKAVDPTPNGPRWWGTSRLAEAVAYPIDIPVVARRMVKHLSPALCGWCRRPIAAGICPFCGSNEAGDRATGGGS
jgi:hypothetical protein